MNKNKLIEAQKEYIKFLSKELSRYGYLAVVKPYMAPGEDVIQKGVELRNKIFLAENEQK